MYEWLNLKHNVRILIEPRQCSKVLDRCGPFTNLVIISYLTCTLMDNFMTFNMKRVKIRENWSQNL